MECVCRQVLVVCPQQGCLDFDSCATRRRQVGKRLPCFCDEQEAEALTANILSRHAILELAALEVSHCVGLPVMLISAQLKV